MQAVQQQVQAMQQAALAARQQRLVAQQVWQQQQQAAALAQQQQAVALQAWQQQQAAGAAQQFAAKQDALLAEQRLAAAQAGGPQRTVRPEDVPPWQRATIFHRPTNSLAAMAVWISANLCSCSASFF
jgi:hypothetical protein